MKIPERRQSGTIRVKRSFPNTPYVAVQQQFKDHCDLNKIVAKYKTTGRWQEVVMAGKGGVYADISAIGDYQESVEKVLKANNAFMTLPAEIRVRFNNDPGELLQFIQDPRNFEEGKKLGLFKATQVAQDTTPNTNLNDKGETHSDSKPPSSP